MSGPVAEPSGPDRSAILRVAVPGVLIQLAFGLSFVWGAVAPAVRAQAHWSSLAIGAVFSAVPLGYAVGTALGGWLAERVAAHRLCWASLLLLAGSFLIAFLLPNAATFMLCYSGLGLGLGGGVALAGTLAAGSQLLGNRLGGLAGLLTAAYAGAAIVEAPLASGLLHLLGWLDVLRILGGADVALVAIALYLLPALDRPGSVRSAPAGLSIRGLLGKRALALAVAIELLGTPVGAYALAHLALLAKDSGASGLIVALAIPAAAIGNTAGRLFAGAASDRFGANGPLLVVLAAAVVAAGGLAVLPLGVAVLPFGLLAGVGFGGPAGLASRLARDAAPQSPHAAFGLVFSSFAAGAFLGPILGPGIGGGARAWVLLGLLAAVSFGLAAVRLTRHRQAGSV
ncbi:MAG: MFS transporter [Mycobacteriales bacterium]